MPVSAFDDSLHVFHSAEFQSVVSAALAFFQTTPLHPLPPTNKFIGAGVYGLYYKGDFAPYQPLVDYNNPLTRLPLYVGKAVPKGWRSGRIQTGTDADLHGRLAEHARGIAQVENLHLADFQCRFMILKGPETDLVGPVEGHLIRHFAPVRNSVLSGFGLHDVGGKRLDQLRTEWDTLHPGRSWTRKLTGPHPNQEMILAKIAQYAAALAELRP